MANFNVSIDYEVTDTVTSSTANLIRVTFTLECVAASLTKEYIRDFPLDMYYQNIDNIMDESQLTVQMKSNFLTLAKIDLEEFANLAKAKIKETQGSSVNENITGAVTLNTVIMYITFDSKPKSFTVVWIEN